MAVSTGLQEDDPREMTPSCGPKAMVAGSSRNQSHRPGRSWTQEVSSRAGQGMEELSHCRAQRKSRNLQSA